MPENPPPKPQRAIARPTRRAVLAAGAWSLPVVTLAVAAPGASASGGDPTFTPGDPIASADPSILTFPLFMDDLPAVPASEEGDYIGALVAPCLPEGLQVVAVSSGWAIASGSDDFDGGAAYIYNTVPFTAGTDTMLLVTVQEAPDVSGLHGELGADVAIGTTGFITEVAWPYSFGDPQGAPLANCAAAPAA
ncbi:hypothetical protein [Herbiconiux sp.]|uniref:hypothetical protein n=1 Tax=Herbiconiux sp. TaxID=1871186 RepID=UPI0025C2AF49|nr:hypothetical protein [Herbiconiux sp.]